MDGGREYGQLLSLLDLWSGATEHQATFTTSRSDLWISSEEFNFVFNYVTLYIHNLINHDSNQNRNLGFHISECTPLYVDLSFMITWKTDRCIVSYL